MPPSPSHPHLLSASHPQRLDADGVGDAPEVLHVGAVQLPGAVPDPHEVGAEVVVLAPHRPRQCLLEAGKVEHGVCLISAIPLT